MYHFALGNVNDKVSFKKSSHHPSSSFLQILKVNKTHSDAGRSVSIDVPIRRLDDVFNKCDILSPILLKMDVEGFELEVIKGGEETISLAKIVIIETSFEEIFEGQPLFADILNTMMKLGFKYYGNIDMLFPDDSGWFLQENSVFKR